MTNGWSGGRTITEGERREQEEEEVAPQEWRWGSGVPVRRVERAPQPGHGPVGDLPDTRPTRGTPPESLGHLDGRAWLDRIYRILVIGDEYE